MGWDDFYRRRAAMDAYLAADGALPVPEPFDDLDELLLALHYRWSLRLASRIELSTLDSTADLVDAVSAAWRENAAADPALRRVLDANAERPALREAIRTEQRLVATTAGLTDPEDGPAEAAAVGAAFLTLLRSKPPRRNLFRRLVPSA